MKTIHLSDEGYAQVAAALEEKGQGQEMLIDLLAGRRGPDSEEVKAEEAKLVALTNAAHEFYGVSTWRSNAGRILPVDSVFFPASVSRRETR